MVIRLLYRSTFLTVLFGIASSIPLCSQLPIANSVDLGTINVQKALVREDGRIYALQPSLHRIAVFSPDGAFESQIGSIGQGLGEMYYPIDFAFGPHQELVLLEGDEKRVQILDFSGRCVAHFALVHQANSIAVGIDGTIMVADPYDSGLVTLYDRQGRKIRSFGAKIRFSDIYGQRHTALDAKYRRGINRVLLATSGEGSIFVAFIGAPLLRQYSNSGVLLHEWRYPPALDASIVSTIRRTLTVSSSEKFAEDGVTIPSITTGIAFDSVSHLLQWTADWNGPHLLSLDIDRGLLEDLSLPDVHLHLSSVSMTPNSAVSIALMKKSGKDITLLYLNVVKPQRTTNSERKLQ